MLVSYKLSGAWHGRPGVVGWRHDGDPVGPVCDTCMSEREETLGDLLKIVRAQGNGGTN